MSSEKEYIKRFINKHEFVDIEITGKTSYLSIENVEILLKRQKKYLTSYKTALKNVAKAIKKDKDLALIYEATISLLFYEEYELFKANNNNAVPSNDQLTAIGEIAAKRFIQYLTAD